MSWEIVTGLIIIVGCLISLGTVLAKLVSTLTRLDVTIGALQKTVTEDKESNTKTHARIFDKLEEQDKRIDGIKEELHGKRD